MTESTAAREITLRATRIVAFAIVTGPAIFLGVVFFLRSRGGLDFSPDSSEGAGGQGEDPTAAWQVLEWALMAIMFSAIAAHIFVPRLLRQQQGGTVASFQAMTIVRLAVTEAVALLGCVSYMLSGSALSAGIAIAMIGFMASMQFPTGDRLDRWIDRPAC